MYIGLTQNSYDFKKEILEYLGYNIKISKVGNVKKDITNIVQDIIVKHINDQDYLNRHVVLVPSSHFNFKIKAISVELLKDAIFISIFRKYLTDYSNEDRINVKYNNQFRYLIMMQDIHNMVTNNHKHDNICYFNFTKKHPLVEKFELNSINKKG
jgi:putative lipoic acid-binding regulatory protein